MQELVTGVVGIVHFDKLDGGRIAAVAGNADIAAAGAEGVEAVGRVETKVESGKREIDRARRGGGVDVVGQLDVARGDDGTMQSVGIDSAINWGVDNQKSAAEKSVVAGGAGVFDGGAPEGEVGGAGGIVDMSGDARRSQSGQGVELGVVGGGGGADSVANDVVGVDDGGDLVGVAGRGRATFFAKGEHFAIDGDIGATRIGDGGVLDVENGGIGFAKVIGEVLGRVGEALTRDATLGGNDDASEQDASKSDEEGDLDKGEGGFSGAREERHFISSGLVRANR